MDNNKKINWKLLTKRENKKHYGKKGFKFVNKKSWNAKRERINKSRWYHTETDCPPYRFPDVYYAECQDVLPHLLEIDPQFCWKKQIKDYELLLNVNYYNIHKLTSATCTDTNLNECQYILIDEEENQ